MLKQRTRALHDRLDAAVGHAAVGSEANYVAFLGVQYSARAPIERWALSHLPPELRPPATVALIAQDLSDLAASLPHEAPFPVPEAGGGLGLVWAIGGSSLGNKALLARRRRAGLVGADRFLSDAATTDYFLRMLPRLEMSVSPIEQEAAVAAATAVFATFLAAANFAGLRAAA